MSLTSESQASNYYTVAFYNLENLFDTVDDPTTFDDDFLPGAEKRWTPKRYKKKLRKLGYTIAQIGAKVSGRPPVIVGVAEVENLKVVEDLIQSKFLKDKGYAVVHFDSSDERGIDVAMIYDTAHFEVLHTETIKVPLKDHNGEPDHTRDILMVEGLLNGERLFVFVNHWPSRRAGEEETRPRRVKASSHLIDGIHKIKEREADPKIIVMGDFNDGPASASILQLTEAHGLYNPMERLLSTMEGSLSHRLEWYLFDQILFSTNFFESRPGNHCYSKADIFNREFLKQYEGKYKGTPFRTYVGRKYKGGYSDHFPVFMHLKKHE